MSSWDNDDWGSSSGSSGSSSSGGWSNSSSGGSWDSSWPQGNSGGTEYATTGGGQQPEGTSGLSDTTSAPLLWLALGLTCVVASLVLWLVSSGLTLAIVGWLAAGPIAIGLWAVFLVADGRRRAQAWYVPSSFAQSLSVALAATALAVTVLQAYHVADTVSRLV